MSPERLRRPPAILSLAILALGAAVPDPALEGPYPPAELGPGGKAAWTEPLPAAYREAAAAIRSRDFATARRLLEPLASEAPLARVVLGLYAHACEEIALAEALLAEGGDGRLEDWRLYLLADSAAARGHYPAAQAALTRLLEAHPASPLRPKALLKSASLAWDRGDLGRALELVRQGQREEDMGREIELRLDLLAWEIGVDGGDPDARRTAARRLLVRAPLEASRRRVVEVFRRPDGEVPWQEILTPEETMARSRSLLESGLPSNTLSTLEQVPEDRRGLHWSLLRAEALTAAERGGEALEVLRTLAPATAEEEAAVEWARAMAALDRAAVRPGPSNPPAERRQALRRTAQGHLWRIAEIGASPEMAARALCLIYLQLADEERFEEAIEVLRRLRELDPADTTGARNLWQQGWREYSERNYSGAVGYWSELESLYPESAYARSGRYWTGRAHEALGNAERAREIFRHVAAADTTDFYRRYALQRLGGAEDGEAPTPLRAVEPWPSDPVLERARLLSDLGLEDLALAEAETLAERAEPRALAALQAIALARKGERRQSITALRRAFAALGGPGQGSVPTSARRLFYPLDYRETIEAEARRNGLPSALVFAMIRQESAFDPNARSWAGAHGLMQLMPATGQEVARRIGVSYSTSQLSEPAYSVQLGTAYFRQLLAMFAGNVELALAGYNSGPYRIKRLWQRAGPAPELDRFLEGLSPEEPKTYVKRILLFADSYRQLYPELD